MKHLLIVFAVLLVLSIPVMAQDAVSTVEAGQVTVIDGAGSGDTNITVEAPETPVETPATNVLSISNIISFLLGGVIMLAGVIAWFGTQARNAMNDPAKMVIAEKLGDSVPAETANKLIDGLTDIVSFLREATDRQPLLLKPPTSSVSGTPYASASTLSGVDTSAG